MIPAWGPMVYVALFTPAPSGSVMEIPTTVWTNYHRVAVPNDLAHWPPIDHLLQWNGQPVDFGIATVVGAGPLLTRYGVMNADHDGDYLCSGILLKELVVTNGKHPVFGPGKIVVKACP